ncbi:CAAX amino terminal protease self-immunity [Ruegeria denitrificans]|uniref:CAAX amino terminal protease self-immunity n=1 Tax=Ruegeria denitrificans TaxID=1715692 RepID=A0A0P1I1P4_9RHOB|nr:CPBP family intramembrane glutamic endopeptidase [Ruegeria denitrificans]CUJ84984.1 CAAX amino terminal protease self-immunity [Ruegeria denitrificans]
MSKHTDWAGSAVPHMRLRLEFGLFFVAVPVLIAVLFPPDWMFPSLFTFTAIGIVLLYFTPGFVWDELRYNWRNWSWREVAVFTVAMTVFCAVLVMSTRPEAAFFLLRNRPEFLLVIWLAYPLLSALPQELLFRSLFFRRYHAILPNGRAAYLLNAALFSLAHLMYWSWIVAIMTFAGGLLFTWAYRKRGSFFYAVLLHAIAGNIIFAAGLGIYFYSGNVQRPF